MMDRKVIEDKLIQAGILPNMKGFKYIVDAVKEYKPGMPMMDVYDWVAKINGSNAHRVEKNIRHAKGKSETYKGYTNAAFISLLQWELRQDAVQMSTYYFTFGSSDQLFDGGWVEIKAVNLLDAQRKFERRYGSKSRDNQTRLLRYSDHYNERQFKETNMAKTGNFGAYCYEVIV